MYIRATHFFEYIKAGSWSQCTAKNEWIILHQKRQTRIYTSIFVLTAKITFQWFKVF